MTYRTDKAAFVAQFKHEEIPIGVARALLEHAATLQRIAVGDCSDEAAYKLNERNRSRCPACAAAAPQDRTYELGAAGKAGSLGACCPEHRAEYWIRSACREHGIVPYFDGDPRGAVVKLRMSSGRGNSYGDPTLLCVPTRD